MASNVVRNPGDCFPGDVFGYIALNDFRIHQCLRVKDADTESVDVFKTLPDGLERNQFWVILPEYLPAELDYRLFRAII